MEPETQEQTRFVRNLCWKEEERDDVAAERDDVAAERRFL